MNDNDIVKEFRAAEAALKELRTTRDSIKLPKLAWDSCECNATEADKQAYRDAFDLQVKCLNALSYARHRFALAKKQLNKIR